MAIYYIIEPWYKKGGGIDPVLNNNDWATIQKAAQDGVASQYWSVGDRKKVILNGTVGLKTFSNYEVYVYILGFNHNASIEGDNTIHFQFGFDALTGGNHIAFCDSAYGSLGSTDAFRMRLYDSNSLGWAGSLMKSTIIPAFRNAMPSDLQSVLKAVTKYTDNEYSVSKHNTASYVKSTSDSIFLLAEYELYGRRSNANQYEKNYQLQYDYYKNGNTITMYQDTNKTSTAYWWLRSPYYNSDTAYMRDLGGADSATKASASSGFAPAFVVG